MDTKKVLLTGISGFLGAHTAIRLLEKGYHVKGTLRDLNRAPSIKEVIAKHTRFVDRLSFAEADLSTGNVWSDLMEGMDYVQHIASPFPREMPKHEDELILPAKEGVLHILNAAASYKIKRVVLTSSGAAVVYGKTKEQLQQIMDESVWTDINCAKDLTPYFKSKTIAEATAWKFMKENPSEMELVTVLPGAILGPVLENDYGTSANIVVKLMDGSMPAVPKIGFEIIDVRSVADALIKAMEVPSAANNRYLLSSGFLMLKDIAEILKKAYPKNKIPTKELPNFIIKLFSKFDSSLQPVMVDLGVKRRVNVNKAKTELNWQPIPPEEAVLSCARSLFEQGIL
ncbi:MULTISPECIES: SDR family oxidoreductase [Chryseobacterium]|uniref:Dihydroflavonol-4-reductase n=1 Tax=Chryseobacterium camelliae TaxID=1265445 RepID=A0ABU0TIN6_9FLAO|nr:MULTISPECIES: aldehyde reductase [Chryseobacterium]MDT3409221.1 dihydroflavonol-4-reductase [Pseudacidovorax intermedius]MDQ1096917.1 dihydroflavonol-4-reductase [Chryseobacterium camelliae]MDQ1100859.1 dihydroflavonol-4-reductase [Chryseobacterium sp. SORGH_AS_1048]MDR6084301.1 dihydroflavonol-4-reductase [Chryseobacterium sp. SORGH_AS_0909]MDR6132572.1 dihydroflavonol-4-reductase [Chryseobacterium sp. SORGH_AS_1175]